jgi:hypothetical protein
MCPINFVFMSCKVKKQESPVEQWCSGGGARGGWAPLVKISCRLGGVQPPPPYNFCTLHNLKRECSLELHLQNWIVKQYSHHCPAILDYNKEKWDKFCKFRKISITSRKILICPENFWTPKMVHWPSSKIIFSPVGEPPLLTFQDYTTAVELCGSKNFSSVSVFLEQKSLGSVSVIFKKEEQYKCMNSFMYVSSIFTK